MDNITKLFRRFDECLGNLFDNELVIDSFELDALQRIVSTLESACKTGVGYEPLNGSLEPKKFSEALKIVNRIAGEVLPKVRKP